MNSILSNKSTYYTASEASMSTNNIKKNQGQ